MDYAKEDLTEAVKQIDSLLHKLGETVRTLESKERAERYRPQITLARRRIRALALSKCLLEAELLKMDAGEGET